MTGADPRRRRGILPGKPTRAFPRGLEAAHARIAPAHHNGGVAARETSWTLIDSARGGDPRAREEFARDYAPVVRAYFAARWSGGRMQADVDDGVQEVFVDCLREGGALTRSDSTRPFRPFLYGVARTVALRFEQRRGKRPPSESGGEEPAARDTRLSVIFDRAFAVQVMREATEVQRARAGAEGGPRSRRVELLELHFQQGRSIPEIAQLWNEDPARVHHIYADAREDFRDALREVVQRRSGGTAADVERECAWMLDVLRKTSA